MVLMGTTTVIYCVLQKAPVSGYTYRYSYGTRGQLCLIKTYLKYATKYGTCTAVCTAVPVDMWHW
eukprot:SAG31_NODE_13594_length_859_cov_0.810526_1_plen_64_part_10